MTQDERKPDAVRRPSDPINMARVEAEWWAGDRLPLTGGPPNAQDAKRPLTREEDPMNAWGTRNDGSEP